MVLRALPEASCLMRLFATAHSKVRLAGADVCFAGHANNVGGALVPRPGFILHQATKAKVLSVSLFGLRCSQPIRQVFRLALLRRGFVRCSK